MVADLVVRAFADHPLTAVDVAVDPHLLGDDLPEFDRRTARTVLLVPVVAFDDLDVGSAGHIFERLGSLLDEFHSDVDRHAGVGSQTNWDH